MRTIHRSSVQHLFSEKHCISNIRLALIIIAGFGFFATVAGFGYSSMTFSNITGSATILSLSLLALSYVSLKKPVVSNDSREVVKNEKTQADYS